jgi:hypothetical protein
MKTLVLAVLLAFSQPEEPTSSAVAETIAKLKLSPEQAGKVTPILTEQAAQLKALREKMGPVQNASLGTKMKMRKEVQAIDAKADAQLKPILSEAQMKALMDLRKERRSKVN